MSGYSHGMLNSFRPVSLFLLLTFLIRVLAMQFLLDPTRAVRRCRQRRWQEAGSQIHRTTVPM